MDLRNWREKEGLTQADLAAKVGVHVQYVSDLERGKKTPSLSLARKFRDLSGGLVSLDSLADASSRKNAA